MPTASTSATGNKPVLSDSKLSENLRDRLPKGWLDTIDPIDQEWIGKSLFTQEKKLVSSIILWWYPPQPRHRGFPQPDYYFGRRLFLWAPYQMWQVQFKCPRCPKKLAGKGLYNKVRTVLDLKSAYYLASEYLESTDCKGNLQTWDHRLVSQLANHVAARFPCILTN